MPQVDRFSVSLDTELLAAFDHHIAAKGYQNRSEAIRDLIRDLLVAGWLRRGEEPVSAMLTVVCDHEAGEAAARLRACLANSADLVCGSFHLAIDDHRDWQAVGLRGSVEQVQAFANEIQAMRGVAHGHLSVVPQNASFAPDD